MAGNGISGRDGTVKISSVDVKEIKKWSFNPKCSTPQYASNMTGGYKRTVPGIRDATGTIDGVFDPDDYFITVIAEGTVATLD